MVVTDALIESLRVLADVQVCFEGIIDGVAKKHRSADLHGRSSATDFFQSWCFSLCHGVSTYRVRYSSFRIHRFKSKMIWMWNPSSLDTVSQHIGVQTIGPLISCMGCFTEQDRIWYITDERSVIPSFSAPKFLFPP